MFILVPASCATPAGQEERDPLGHMVSAHTIADILASYTLTQSPLVESARSKLYHMFILVPASCATPAGQVEKDPLGHMVSAHTIADI
ncbi:Hypp9145 [Branchiostoma lanceolatum]|uniref:Hypp9145 protein n=1 Tax=Branchiostoma lanceolatum TaxID=7740 RepID=A0A8J9ZDM4_BRALA|nr:Hypp9145 [Branchiostoma lanceolatum]